MPSEDLSKGAFMRQVLKGKRKIRIAFLPDDTALQPESTIRANDLGEKITWRTLLEKDNPDPASVNLDIDAGVTFLRFNSDMISGTATFFPVDKNQPVIVNHFLQDDSSSSTPSSSPEAFANCLASKTGGGMKAVEAIATCLPELFK